MVSKVIVELFRIKIIQFPLIKNLEQKKEASELIPVAVNNTFQRQEMKKSGGVRWLFGKPEIGAGWVRFNFGKASRSTRSAFDNNKQDFVAREMDDGDHTTVYIETEFGIVGIVRNSKLVSGDMSSTAHKIAQKMATDCGITHVSNITIAAIGDPMSLIKIIDDVAAVTTLRFQSTPPNPFDSKDFPREMEEFVLTTGGKKGTVAVYGKELNKESVKEAVRSQNSLGHPVQLRVREKVGDKTIPKKMDGIANVLLDGSAAVNEICNRLRNKYNQIKRGFGDDES